MEDQLVTITAAGWQARIHPLGAELWSLTGPDGAEYMTDGDPAFWAGHAPVLFPVVGSLAGDRFRHKGEDYALPRHGFARRSGFQLVAHAPDAVTFRLADSEETRAVWPFAFSLEIAFRLAPGELKTEVTVANRGGEAMPFSFGFHPAFAWPLPGGAAKADHVLAFDHAEPQDVRRLDPATGLMLAETFPTPVEGHVLRLDPALFEADAVIWDRLSSREVTFGAPGGTQLAVRFPDCPMLGLWQKPGASFLCIEPWQGHADPQGFAGEIADKPGMVLLPPGEAHVIGMEIAVLGAD